MHLVVANTKFRYRSTHACEKTEVKEKLIADYFLMDKQQCERVKNVRVYRVYEVGSDRLIKTTLSVKLKESQEN